MTTETPQDSSAPSHHRRSREEVETLAKNFIGTPADELPSAKGSRNLLIVSGAGALILVAGIVAVFATSSKDKENRPNADAERVAAEAKEWAARLEAEKERKRKELEAGSDYLDRIGAADAALLKEMSSQAEMLARRIAAAPAPTSDAPPTPREPSKAPAPTTTVASTQPKPTTTTAAAPAPAQPAPQQTAATTTTQAAPTQAAPVQVAQAAKSECSIHVSELSKSGKLTYADIAKMKGARVADNGSVFTPPVKADGRSVVFEVFPNGCVQMVRSSLGR